MPENEFTIEMIRRSRLEHRAMIRKRIRSVGYQTRSALFRRARALLGEHVPAADVIIAASGRGLPVDLGGEWSGVILLDRAGAAGRLFVNEIQGLFPGSGPVVLTAGEQALTQEDVTRLAKLFAAKRLEFLPVPDRCYDGARTQLRIRCGSQVFRSYANASDSGRQRSLVLARLLWAIKRAIPLSEVRRAPAPSAPIGAEPEQRSRDGARATRR